MSSSKAPLAVIIAVTVALAAALAFESVYDVSFRVRPPDPLDIAATQPSYARSVRKLGRGPSGVKFYL